MAWFAGVLVIDVFVSYARDDAHWAEWLAGQLHDRGLDVYFDEWRLLPGDLVVHELEQALPDARSGIVVISPTSQRSPRAREQYAALHEESARRGLRFIPVLIGDASLPPFASTRVHLDFRGAGEADHAAEVDRIAAAIRDHSTAAEPVRRSVVVCFADADQEYGRQLVELLRGAGLPTWSADDLRPGDEHFPMVQRHLRDSVAVVVLMSPQSQHSPEITRMILEGQVHRRPFVPILLRGRRNYHLANTWYLDALDGQLPAPADLAVLHRLHEADRSGTPVDLTTALPAPPLSGTAPAVRVPAASSLELLDQYLADRELVYADLLTTTVLLDAAGRLEDGWLRRADGRALPLDLLSAVDELWSRRTHGRQGFTAQRGLSEIGRSADFLRASVAYGWRASETDGVPRYGANFTGRAGPGGRDGFFPTLRNPQNERFPDWYGRWTTTVAVVHRRIREQRGSRDR